VSGISSASASGADSGSTIYGTNIPPVTFPGIASGIDYNSIISKYSAMTMAQATPLQNSVKSLSAQQAEMLKIQDLLTKFQDTFQAVSDPSAFTATAPASSNASAIGVSTIAGTTATPGNYLITNATLATATQITNDPAANGTVSTTATLASAGLSITPTNGTTGTNGKGQVTIDGVAIAYDVNSDTIQSFQAKANAALAPVGASIAFDTTTQTWTITSSQPLTLGSASDSGNLLTAFKLDTAQITYSGGQYTATSSGKVGGINVGATLDTSGNAGFGTAVTAGTFTINGVSFTVDPTGQNLNDLLNAINTSTAGVIATYDQTDDSIVLTSRTDGPQGITLGASGDTSNFLQAAGFLTNYQQPGALSAGATLAVGKSAEVQYQDTAGTTHTVFANSNTVTTAIPGVQLNLQSPVTAAAPVTVNVASDSSAIQTAIGNFVTAYNAVINEINLATEAPVVGTTSDSTTGQSQAAQLTGGGVLFGNSEIDDLKNQLVGLVSNYDDKTSSSYNSLASIGLQLDSSFSIAAADSSDSANTSSQTGVTSKSMDGTSGQLQTLDVSAFTAALQANPSAVAALFTGPASLIGQLGSYVTSVTGLPTQLTGSLAGTIPPQSLFATISDEQNDQITSLKQQIATITDQANMQANILRKEFVDSETQIATLQSMQQSLAALGGSSSGG